MTSSIIIDKPILSVKKQILAIIFACAFAVIFPQLLHLVGKFTETGSLLASILSPMHFPIIFIGLIAGPFAGAISGILSPIISFVLTGMPIASKLPFMVIELFGYGLCAGILRNFRLNNFVKVFITMFFGRFLQFITVAFLVFAFNKELNVFGIWHSIPKCLPGIILQIVLIPLLVKKFDSTEEIK